MPQADQKKLQSLGKYVLADHVQRGISHHQTGTRFQSAAHAIPCVHALFDTTVPANPDGPYDMSDDTFEPARGLEVQVHHQISAAGWNDVISIYQTMTDQGGNPGEEQLDKHKLNIS
jgi:hypothetical protein